jgi:hypothetical protein
MFANFEEGTQMLKKQKQSKKAAKGSRRTKSPAPPQEEPDTAATSAPAVGQQEVSTVETQQAADAAAEVPVKTVVETPAETPTAVTKPVVTRSPEARAAMAAGRAAHQRAGFPTRQQLTQVFGQKGYLLTWPKRTERFGITPETFQAALAKGVPAVPLTPVAKPDVEKTKGTV